MMESPYNNEVAVLIPARLHSTRLPGKVLFPLKGKAMMEWVYDACQKSKANLVAIVTHDQEVMDYCERRDMNYMGTSEAPRNGSERVAEAATALGERFGFVINVQADEPLIQPGHIDLLIDKIVNFDVEMATLYSLITNRDDWNSENVVKVAVAEKSKLAMYFSRHRISEYKHHGIYAYHADALQILIKKPQTVYEQRERLEQLRALEHGFRIACIEIDNTLHGVDCYADVPKVEELLP